MYGLLCVQQKAAGMQVNRQVKVRPGIEELTKVPLRVAYLEAAVFVGDSRAQ